MTPENVAVVRNSVSSYVQNAVKIILQDLHICVLAR
jgi:hypothetical protein